MTSKHYENRKSATQSKVRPWRQMTGLEDDPAPVERAVIAKRLRAHPALRTPVGRHTNWTCCGLPDPPAAAGGSGRPQGPAHRGIVVEQRQQQAQGAIIEGIDHGQVEQLLGSFPRWAHQRSTPPTASGMGSGQGHQQLSAAPTAGNGAIASSYLPLGAGTAAAQVDRP